jgi:hypothetical protein
MLLLHLHTALKFCYDISYIRHKNLCFYNDSYTFTIFNLKELHHEQNT